MEFRWFHAPAPFGESEKNALFRGASAASPFSDVLFLACAGYPAQSLEVSQRLLHAEFTALEVKLAQGADDLVGDACVIAALQLLQGLLLPV